MPTLGGFQPYDGGKVPPRAFKPTVRAAQPAPVADKKVKPLDLGGRIPVNLLIGGNSTAKTTWARWGVDRAMSDRTIGIAALDRGERMLRYFFEGIQEPDDASEAAGADFLIQYFSFLAQHRAPAVLDFGGGGDVALHEAARLDAGLTACLDDSGLALVAWIFLSPRTQDIQSIVDTNALPFKTAGTVLVLNEHMTPNGDVARTYASVLNHPEYQAALRRGAYVVTLPRLHPPELVLDIEEKGMLFSHAAAGVVPPGSDVAPISLGFRSRINLWLRNMEAAHEQVRSALP